MKTGVSTYSFGWYRTEGQLGILGTIRKAAEMGFEGIEFVEGEWQDKPGMAAEMRRECKSSGITPTAFCVSAELLNCENRDKEVERLCRLCDTAAEIGVPMLRHDVTGGCAGRALPRGYADIVGILADGCRRVTEYAKSIGIKTMTENHGYFSQDAERVEKLINAVASDNFGALIDIGNFICADEDPCRSVGILLPYAFHIHAKDFHKKSGAAVDPGRGWFRTRGGYFVRGAVLGHGDAASAQSLALVAASSYDGFVDLEFEGLEDPYLGMEYGLDNLKKYLGLQ